MAEWSSCILGCYVFGLTTPTISCSKNWENAKFCHEKTLKNLIFLE